MMVQAGDLTDDAKAILLVCGRFGQTGTDAASPLNIRDYNRLADWLVSRDLRPRDLLVGCVLDELKAEPGRLDADRIETLLMRGAALAFAVEKWFGKAIWICSRSDEGYPQRLRRHLGRGAPALIFGVGDRSLLDAGGLAVVGSRNVDAEAEQFTRELATCCAQVGVAVVSGGAKGVDQLAMRGVLEAGGASIGVLANGLARASVAGSYRDGIRDGRVMLVSPYSPEAGFSVGNAMGRNKLIYALADFALVVAADHEKGGTWAGATEELSRDDSKPVFVRVEGPMCRGNQALLAAGARPFPVRPWGASLIQEIEAALGEATSGSDTTEPGNDRPDSRGVPGSADAVEPTIVSEPGSAQRYLGLDFDGTQTTYEQALPVLLGALGTERTPEELLQELTVPAGRLADWLQRAVAAGLIVRKQRPLRYVRSDSDPEPGLGL